MLYDAALVARLCWEEFVHEMTTVTFDVVRHNASATGTEHTYHLNGQIALVAWIILLAQHTCWGIS